MTAALASTLLSGEARALLTRLARVSPLALQETMVAAAAFSPTAQLAIERYLGRGRRALRDEVHGYLRWLDSESGRQAPAAEAQRRYSLLRLKFNVVLSQFDLFSEALSQRSEHDSGIWLAGLDVAARDGLELRGWIEPPPVICYLARGQGGAIRRAHTRLPGGGDNPVAIIRIPRERMIGSGIASSLFHEVGHQGAALLGLVESLQPLLHGMARRRDGGRLAWRLWSRWISEVVADLWAIARVGVASTTGLMSLVSLPPAFVFRPGFDDPHPMPWVRVQLSCALGDALYPHPQWQRLARLWAALYPIAGLGRERRALIARLLDSLPALVTLLVHHRPRALAGRSLGEVMATAEHQPVRLAADFRAWRRTPRAMLDAPPSRVFAAIGQARVDDAITPEDESRVLAGLLKHWALRRTLDDAARCETRTGKLRARAA